MIAHLWPIGPESWTISDIRVAGDVAKAKILFHAKPGSRREAIPYDFRFIQTQGKWKFLSAKDLRPKKTKTVEDVTLPAERELAAATTGPEATLKEFLDYLVDNRSAIDVKNMATFMPAARKIGDGIAVLWAETPAARRARNQATAKLLLQDVAGWQVVDSQLDGDRWQATVELTVGPRHPMAAYLKTKPKAFFKGEKSGDIWRLTDYQMQR